MLEGLDRVDWGRLRHTYGEASDVPQMLRALLSPDAKLRARTLHALFGSLCHQGTVYSATATAVPFLYELLIAPEGMDQSDLACLLACIANGCGYLEVHAVEAFWAATWKKILAEQGKSLEQERRQEAAETAAVHRAASMGLLHLLPYLYDREPEIRRVVAIALGNYPEHTAVTLAALERARISEADEEVREALSGSVESLTQSTDTLFGFDEQRNENVH